MSNKKLNSNGLPIEDVPVEYLTNPYEQNIWGTDRLISKKRIKQYILFPSFKGGGFHLILKLNGQLQNMNIGLLT